MPLLPEFWIKLFDELTFTRPTSLTHLADYVLSFLYSFEGKHIYP